MSAFDDEFGLFSDESDDAERRSTLGARKITPGESVSDEVHRESPRPEKPRASKPRIEKPRIEKPRTEKPRTEKPERAPSRDGYDQAERRPQLSRSAGDPWASQRRATELVDFLARRLVAKPDDVTVELFQDEDGKPLIEVIVDSEDLGKVIGRGGRVAQALRTIARATAEGRVSVDILDKDEAAEEDEDDAE